MHQAKKLNAGLRDIQIILATEKIAVDLNSIGNKFKVGASKREREIILAIIINKSRKSGFVIFSSLEEDDITVQCIHRQLPLPDQ